MGAWGLSPQQAFGKKGGVRTYALLAKMASGMPHALLAKKVSGYPHALLAKKIRTDS